MKLLIVEDNPPDVVLLKHALRAHAIEFEAQVIHDGEEAMQYVHNHSEPDLPDLIVLDLNLPKRDGLEILRAIRDSTRMRTLPVVILTTSEFPPDQARAQELGIDAYLTKPLNLREFAALGAEFKKWSAGATGTQDERSHE